MPPILRWLLALGPTNPIAVRLVQNGSKRTRHMYVRSGYLAVLIVVLLWALIFNTREGDLSYLELARAGASSFTYIAYLQILLIFLLTPIFMAGAISQEANPRTWDILLTTPLSSLQIVLGNLMGRLFFVLALLVAGLPLFALTQYFGGVPGESIFASVLVAACSALVVGTIAIALSTSRLVGKRAVFAFYIASVSYVAITAGVDVWLRQRTGGVTWLTMLNPFLAQQSLLSPSAYPRGGPGDAWFLRHPVSAWCLLSTGLSVLLIGLSAFTARLGGLSWLASRGGRGSVPWYRKMFGLGAAGSDYRPPRSVWHNPIAWREAAARNATLGRIVARWGFITAGLAFGIALVVGLHAGQLGAEEFRLALAVTVWAEVAVITLIALNMAATAVTREREDGTLDLLLATPITPTDYLNGKLRGMIAYLLPLLAVPIGTLAFAGIYVLLARSVLGLPERVEVTRQLLGGAVQAPVMLPEGAIVAALVVVPFIAFCVMVGLMWSVKSRGTIASIVSAAGVVLGVAGVVGLCGWQSASEIEFAGALLAGLSPASALRAIVDPVGAMMGTVGEAGLAPARVFLLIGAAVAAVGQVGVVWAIRVSVVKGFDMTVRRLAGTR